MRFTPALNPATGLPPVSILEDILVHATLRCGDDGEYEYAGESIVDWDSQLPRYETDDDGEPTMVTLTDETGAEWIAYLK